MSALGPVVPKQFVFRSVVVLKEGPLRRATEPAFECERPVATQLVHRAPAGFALQAAGAIGMHMREEFRIVVWPLHARAQVGPLRSARFGLAHGIGS